jgi:hypothetical protein
MDKMDIVKQTTYNLTGINETELDILRFGIELYIKDYVIDKHKQIAKTLLDRILAIAYC